MCSQALQVDAAAEAEAEEEVEEEELAGVVVRKRPKRVHNNSTTPTLEPQAQATQLPRSIGSAASRGRSKQGGSSRAQAEASSSRSMAHLRMVMLWQQRVHRVPASHGGGLVGKGVPMLLQALSLTAKLQPTGMGQNMLAQVSSKVGVSSSSSLGVEGEAGGLSSSRMGQPMVLPLFRGLLMRLHRRQQQQRQQPWQCRV